MREGKHTLPAPHPCWVLNYLQLIVPQILRPFKCRTLHACWILINLFFSTGNVRTSVWNYLVLLVWQRLKVQCLKSWNLRNQHASRDIICQQPNKAVREHIFFISFHLEVQDLNLFCSIFHPQQEENHLWLLITWTVTLWKLKRECDFLFLSPLRVWKVITI